MSGPRHHDAEQDPHDLDRFVRAQAGIYESALAELRAGRKRSHWMWFVFPQLAGLGLSPTSRRYAIRDRAEARVYLAHPVLGPRLIACVDAVLGIQGRSAFEIFGSPDDLKLKSCATLFEAASSQAAFGRLLDRYYGGERDALTLKLLAARE